MNNVVFLPNLLRRGTSVLYRKSDIGSIAGNAFNYSFKEGRDIGNLRWFSFTETDKTFIKLKGSSGAIGFFASLQRDAKQFLDRQFIVQNGGAYFGEANQGLDFYSTQVSDFAGNLQNDGAITVYSAGRQFGVGLQGGNLHAAHVDSEAGYRMGTATANWPKPVVRH